MGFFCKGNISGKHFNNSTMTNEQEKIELLIKVFDNQQTLIANADGKANIALSIQTFITTSILGASIVVDTFNRIIDFNCIVKFSYYLLFPFFLMTSILGLTFCILVFKPRLPQEKKEVERKGITYYGHIEKYKNSNDYLEEINGTKPEDIVKEFAFQNYSLAIILGQKMKFVKYSTSLLFINIVLGILLLIFSLATK